MGSDLIRKSFNYTKKNRNSVIAFGALGITLYGVYRIHTSYAEKKKKILKLFSALNSMADTFDMISKDFNEFTLSYSDEIPNSINQISKIAKTELFSESLMKICSALVVGILMNHSQDTSRNQSVSKIKNPSISKRVVDIRVSRSRDVLDLETEDNEDDSSTIKSMQHVIGGNEDNISLIMTRSLISNESKSLKSYEKVFDSASEVVEVVNLIETSDHVRVIRKSAETSDWRRSDTLQTGVSLCLQILNSPWSFVPD